MDVFDYTKAFTDFWSTQARALMQGQEQAGKAITEGLQAASAAMPGLPGFSTDLSAGAADLSKASQAMLELSSAAAAMAQTMTGQLPSVGSDPTMEAILGRITDPRQWLAGTGDMDDVLGRMAEGPRFADLWEIERLYARVTQAWMQVRRRGLEHNAVVMEAWLQAGRQFMEEFAGRSAAEGTAPDSKAIVALWTDVANRQLLATQRSEAFLATQREMIRATTELKMAQQNLVEHFGKQYGFPTRVELDDVHRTMTELRREVRQLRREQRNHAAAVAAPAQEPSAPTTGRRTPVTPPLPARKAAARQKGAP